MRRIASAAALTSLFLSLGAVDAQATTGAATIAGILTDAQGLPAAGISVSLEPLVSSPALVRDETAYVDTATTSTAGAFALTVTPTSALVAEAQGNGGVLNLELFAVAVDYVAVAPAVGDANTKSSYFAVEGIVVDLVPDSTVVGGYRFDGPAAISLSLRQMQVATSDEDTAITVSTGDAAPAVEPSPQAVADETDALVGQATDTAGTAGEDTQKTADGATGVTSTDVVRADNTTVNTVVDTADGVTDSSDLLREIKASAGEGGNSDPHRFPSDPCPWADTSSATHRYPTHVTYRSSNGHIALGEIHTPTNTTAEFTYVTNAKTTIGVGISAGGGRWGIEYRKQVGRNSAYGNTLTVPARTYRHVYGTFNWHDERKYMCVGSRNGSYMKTYWDRRVVDSWTGALKLGPTNLSGWNTKKYWDEAVADPPRAHDFGPNQSPWHQNGEGYEYKFETNVWGLHLGANSDYGSDIKIEYTMGNHTHHRLFGSDASPMYAKITYSYG